jgi:hypothetical protein
VPEEIAMSETLRTLLREAADVIRFDLPQSHCGSTCDHCERARRCIVDIEAALASELRSERAPMLRTLVSERDADVIEDLARVYGQSDAGFALSHLLAALASEGTGRGERTPPWAVAEVLLNAHLLAAYKQDSETLDELSDVDGLTIREALAELKHLRVLRDHLIKQLNAALAERASLVATVRQEVEGLRHVEAANDGPVFQNVVRLRNETIDAVLALPSLKVDLKGDDTRGI